MSIKAAIFFTESYAHLQGQERQLLPMVDAARLEYAALAATLREIVDEIGPEFETYPEKRGMLNRLSFLARRALDGLSV